MDLSFEINHCLVNELPWLDHDKIEIDVSRLGFDPFEHYLQAYLVVHPRRDYGSRQIFHIPHLNLAWEVGGMDYREFKMIDYGLFRYDTIQSRTYYTTKSYQGDGQIKHKFILKQEFVDAMLAIQAADRECDLQHDILLDIAPEYSEDDDDEMSDSD